MKQEDFLWLKKKAQETLASKNRFGIVAESSGKHKGKSRISRRGRKRLRHGMYMAALSVIRCNDDFRTVYEYFLHRDENPLKKMQALIAVACKLLRVMYAILKKGVSYDGAKMLADIRSAEADTRASASCQRNVAQ